VIFSDLTQILVTGIAMGGVYTLMGLGLFITFLTTRALNFGQGDFLMIAAFVGMMLLKRGLPVAVAVPVALVALAGLGVVLERGAVRPLARHLAGSAGSLAWILTTLGFGLILQNTATVIWGKSRFYSPPLFSSSDKQLVTLLGTGFYLEEIVVAGLTLAVVGGFYWFLFRAQSGKEIGAVAFDADTASLLGIDVKRVVVLSYVVMALLSGVAGVLVGPITTVQSHMGLVFLLKGFAVVCIGGFTNPLGILIAGVGFGVMERVSNYVDSAFGDLYPFVFVLLFLVARPSGLFAERRADVR
jgi:branched-chain amino acid transport system permease protein